MSAKHWTSPSVASGKDPHAKAGDVSDAGSIPGWGRSPGGGNGNPLQYTCLEDSMDSGAWWTIWSKGSQRDMAEGS